MALPPFERKLEDTLAKMLTGVLGIPVEYAEELVCHRQNRFLRGGVASATLTRPREDCYEGLIWVALPCKRCRDDGDTWLICHSRLEGRSAPIPVDPADVPADFHMEVGAEQQQVMNWEWRLED